MATSRDFVVKKGLVVTEDIELGHATDTTIARASAGAITIEGVAVPTVSSTSTLTNKTLTAPVINIGSDAEGDIYYRTSGGAFTRLARGSDNQTLMMNGNVPNWETVSGGGSGDVEKVGTPVNNQVGVWTGDGTIEGDAKLTWDGTEQLELTDSDAGSGWGPILSLYHDSASPLANDGLGNIRFYGKDSVGNKEEYARIRAKIADESSGTEDVQLKFGTVNAGTFDEDMLVLSEGGVSGTVIKDEDNLASNSATHLATQQSIKAYVDANAGGGGASALDGLSDVADSTDANLTESIVVGNAVGSVASGTWDRVYYLTALGSGAAANITTGDGITAIGRNAGRAITTGSDSVFIGSGAGSNSDGTSGVTTATHNYIIGNAGSGPMTGSKNVIMGATAGYDLTSGHSNVMLGYRAAANQTTGNSMVAIGHDALYTGTGQNFMTAVGHSAGYSHTGTEGVLIGSDAGRESGSGNGAVHIGRQAGYYATGNDNVSVGRTAMFGTNGSATGTNNVAMGRGALYTYTSASGSTAIGHNTLYNLTSGGYNVAVGYQTMYNASDGEKNTCVGYQAMYNHGGNYNVALGYRTLYGASEASSTGGYNVAIGEEAMKNNTSGGASVCIGWEAGKAITSGGSNIAIGRAAGWSMTDPNYNIFIGEFAGKLVTTNNYCVAVGHFSQDGMTGSNNVSMGVNTLGGTGAGEHNTAIGNHAGHATSSGTRNIFLGQYAGSGVTSGDNNVVIGKADVTADADDQLSISSGDGSPIWITGDSAGKVTMNDVSPAEYNTWAQFFYQRDDVGTGTVNITLPTQSGADSTAAGYPMPVAGVVKAISFQSSGVSLSGSDAQTWRVRVNGSSSAGDYEDFTFSPADMANPSGTNFVYTKTRLELSVDANDLLQIRRQAVAGSVSYGDVNCIVYVDFS